MSPRLREIRSPFRQFKELRALGGDCITLQPVVGPASSDVMSPAIQLSAKFLYQSFFDQTQLQNAMLQQANNQPIAPQLAANQITTTIAYQNGPIDSQLKGYGVGLHPSSQSPVAVQFVGASADVYVLKPGQIIRPTGKVSGRRTAFDGFRFGIPFGWLGGGMVTLVVFQTPDADTLWHGNPEIVFHRMTVPIKQGTDLTAGGNFNNAPRNWPLRFPWSQALQGLSQVPQKGSAVISVNPTKVILVLRGTTGGGFNALAQPAQLRILFHSSNDFALDSTGAVQNTLQPVFEDVVWNAFSSTGASGNLVNQNPGLVLTGLTSRLAADDGGVVFLDISPGALLNGLFVDVARYGTL